MHRVFLALGSNLGKREELLAAANTEIEKIGKISAASSIYETQPLGNSTAWFLNQVIEIQTDFTPTKLFEKLKAIEIKLGRKKREKWEEREIDLDILFYDSEMVDLPNLQIPHPEIPNRNFVLIPLAEIAKDFIHPQLGKTIEELLKSSPDNLQVKSWIPSKLKN